MKFFTWQELITLWKLKDFQLFNLLKKDLQPYTQYGKKIVDSDSSEQAPRNSVETIKRNLRAKKHAQVLGSPGTASSGSPFTEEQVAQRIFKSQRLEIVNRPKDCAIISFTLPLNEIKARKKLMQAQGWLFKGDNVLEVARKHDLPLPSEKATGPGVEESETADKRSVQQEKANEPPYEDFIRNLMISYESDLHIKIQEPRKESISYNHKVLGFRDRKKPWNTLLDILQEPNHTYHVTSGADRKRLNRISAKLVKYFNDHYPVQIPKDFSLFERCPNERPGTYKLKIKVVDPNAIKIGRASKYVSLSNDKLLDAIERLGKKQREISKFSDGGKEEKEIQEKLKTAIAIARGRDIPDHEIKYQLKEDKEDIRYDPHENEKLQPKDY